MAKVSVVVWEREVKYNETNRKTRRRNDKAFLSHSALSVEFVAFIHNSAGVAFGKAVMESSTINIGLYPSEKNRKIVYPLCK